jgi:hypothetical protein
MCATKPGLKIILNRLRVGVKTILIEAPPGLQAG